MYNKVADIYCKDPNLLLSVFNEMVESGMNEEEALSSLYAFCPTKRAELYLRSVLPISRNNILICPETRNSKNPTNPIEVEKYIKWIKTFNNMEFDYVIQNPPYDGKRNLFVKFFNEGLDILSKNGRMVIIGPATWLINLRKNGKAALYDALKDRVTGNVVKVEMDNLNKPFGIANTVPFSTTVIDMSKTSDTITFTCCGVTEKVKSIYDCNHIGNFELINSIFNKISQVEKVSKHITSEQFNNPDVFYVQTSDIIWAVAGLYHQRPDFCLSDNAYFSTSNGDFFQSFVAPIMHISRNDITNVIPKKAARGGSTTGKVKLTDNPANCVYGTKQEMENYKHYVTTNSLPLFLNICLSIDQHNNSINYVPWLVDKQYTDEEINEMFGFTDEEIALIDRTIKKYERNSPWFKRYMCGPGSVDSDPKKEEETINNFINSL